MRLTTVTCLHFRHHVATLCCLKASRELIVSNLPGTKYPSSIVSVSGGIDKCGIASPVSNTVRPV